MRMILAGMVFVGLTAGLANAADKLDAKFLVGKWSMASVLKAPPKNKTAFNNVSSGTIEFKDDGTYFWKNGPTEFKGSYFLKGTTLTLTNDGKILQDWKNLSLKDGKIYQPLGKESDMVFTRLGDR
ncbi:lipocalin-like domain-containing protein [Zavarzinella formosa]|uniref:lipocalin family protein n=1 Tax=Zavarzinella formosa TaxID=360055 RepID=UPI00037C06C8|nr:lipocalin family protein [Zavarzinella formosa]